MSELNDWFLSLPEARQAVLRDDKWFLAEAAFAAGKAARAQPAQATSEIREIPAFEPTQAGQVLTIDEIEEAFQQAADADDETHIRFARAIEQAVLAKRVPMTDEEMIVAIDTIPPNGKYVSVFEAGIRAAERHHGIVGEKGGA